MQAAEANGHLVPVYQLSTRKPGLKIPNLSTRDQAVQRIVADFDMAVERAESFMGVSSRFALLDWRNVDPKWADVVEAATSGIQAVCGVMTLGLAAYTDDSALMKVSTFDGLQAEERFALQDVFDLNRIEDIIDSHVMQGLLKQQQGKNFSGCVDRPRAPGGALIPQAGSTCSFSGIHTCADVKFRDFFGRSMCGPPVYSLFQAVHPTWNPTTNEVDFTWGGGLPVTFAHPFDHGCMVSFKLGGLVGGANDMQSDQALRPRFKKPAQQQQQAAAAAAVEQEDYQPPPAAAAAAAAAAVGEEANPFTDLTNLGGGTGSNRTRSRKQKLQSNEEEQQEQVKRR